MYFNWYRQNKSRPCIEKFIDTIHFAGQNAFVDEPEKATRYKYGYYLMFNIGRRNRKKKE
jgi:hypothetical protein